MRQGMNSSCDIADIEELHTTACAAKQTFYTDPKTGLLVFTSYHLSQRPCCHSGCRHCPYSPTRQPRPRVLSGSLDDLPEHVDVHFWSGGKDSFLALRSCAKRHILLLTTYDAAANRVAMQDVSINDVIRQARTLGYPLLGVPVGGDYVQSIQVALNKIRDAGIAVCKLVFGDLHLAHIRKWRETHLARLRVQLHFPLWHVPYPTLLRWLKESRVVARVSAVDRGNRLLNHVMVGDVFDHHFVRALPEGVDEFGENGTSYALCAMLSIGAMLTFEAKPLEEPTVDTEDMNHGGSTPLHRTTQGCSRHGLCDYKEAFELLRLLTKSFGHIMQRIPSQPVMGERFSNVRFGSISASDNFIARKSRTSPDDVFVDMPLDKASSDFDHVLCLHVCSMSQWRLH